MPERRARALTLLRAASASRSYSGTSSCGIVDASRMVELDEVAGRVADVHLDPAVRELVHRVAEALVVERAELLHPAVDRHEVVDLEPEMGVRRRLAGPLEEVDLAVTGAQPEDGEPEVRARERLEPELLDVEALRRLDVGRDDADVVEHGPRRIIATTAIRPAQAAARSRPKCAAVSGSPVACSISRSQRTERPGCEHPLGEQRPAAGGRRARRIHARGSPRAARRRCARRDRCGSRRASRRCGSSPPSRAAPAGGRRTSW